MRAASADATLGRLSRSFVEETESLKQSGAGAGLTDND